MSGENKKGYEKKHLAWGAYSDQGKPGGAIAPDRYKNRDDLSYAFKGQEGPEKYRERLNAQGKGRGNSK